MTIDNQRFLVFGLGRAGVASALLLRDQNAQVWVTDDDAKKQVPGCKSVALADIVWDQLDYVVLSPGVPLYFPKPHAVVEQARLHGVPILCDVHLLQMLQPHATYVAITGTNGKSTTTALLHHLLKTAGKSVAVGGNIGTAAATLATTPSDMYVLELSSYQCDLLYDAQLEGLAAPLAQSVMHYSALLNITPDHIDRHGTMENYVAAKLSLLTHTQEAVVIAVEDVHTQTIAANWAAEEHAAHLLEVTHDQAEPTAFLPGLHNQQNIAVASALAQQLGLNATQIEEGLASFTGLTHRLEQVGHIGPIKVVNDSKATNAISAQQALMSVDQPIYWILGGQSKEGGIEVLSPYFSHIAHAYLIGESATALAATLHAHQVEHQLCDTIEQAVKQAVYDAQATGGEAVLLLSPACASFDQFSSFEARGDAFKKAVKPYLHKDA